MNEYDSELVRSMLAGSGYKLIDNEGDADIILLNTCSVRENAVRRVFGHIASLRHNLENKHVLIGVLGCIATDRKEQLIDNKRRGIDFIAGPDSYRRLPQIIERAVATSEKIADTALSKEETYDGLIPDRKNETNAWIAVMRGCDNFCSFCIVPHVRGRERSRSVQSVVDEAQRAAGNGYRQVTLLGQNVNSYRHGDHDFAYLLQQVSEVNGIERIRFMSPNPKDFPDSLIDVAAYNKKVCKHIHLPLQAANDRILKAMNRQYTREDFLALVEKIRNHCPGIALTTDIITGFPTETDAEFQDTVDVMQQVRFDAAFIFKYSVRENTAAAKKYTDDVTEEKKAERIVRLNEIQKQISLEKNREHINRVHTVLIEHEHAEKSEDNFQGRTGGNIRVIFPKTSKKKNQFEQIFITDATPHVLKGRVATADECRNAEKELQTQHS